MNSQIQDIGRVATKVKQMIGNWKAIQLSKLFVAMVPKGHNLHTL